SAARATTLSMAGPTSCLGMEVLLRRVLSHLRTGPRILENSFKRWRRTALSRLDRVESRTKWSPSRVIRAALNFLGVVVSWAMSLRSLETPNSLRRRSEEVITERGEPSLSRAADQRTDRVVSTSGLGVISAGYRSVSSM